MSKDRLMCKHCGNADMAKMNFSEGGKYLSCHICHANTPLYDSFIYHQYEEDMTKKLANILKLGQHDLENGELDHAVKKFNEALTISADSHVAWWSIYACEYAFAAYYDFKDNYGNGGNDVKAGILSDLIQKYASKAIDTTPKL